jgi:spore maturation protein CgeB
MPGWVTGVARERRSRARDGRDIACRDIKMTSPAVYTDAVPASAASKLCGRLAIVGSFDGMHVGGSLWRAATDLGTDTAKFDVSDAGRGNRILRAALWRFGDRRPPRMHRFSKSVVAGCKQLEPEVLIATGRAPLTGSALRALRAMGIVCVNYSTDDPWNPVLRASWHLRVLPEYDAVFTTRRANIGGFTDIGCGEVHYLPFGYDEWLLCRPARGFDGPAPDVLFVGGADRDRVAFMTEFLRTGPRVALVGGYWERFPATQPYALGQRGPEALCTLTAAANVNLCLVRRANRDGHVMRSFEIAALGGCMLAEDTVEHREIFGPDGEAVVYFRNPREAAERARSLLADPAERVRLSAVVRARISRGAHTYRDRLVSILEAATRIRREHGKLRQSAGR